MLSYSYFADFYDNLTNNVHYERYGEYILQLAEKYNHNMGITLDLACGTGSLTLWLTKKGVDIYGIDASAEMLSVAQEKALDNDISGMLFLIIPYQIFFPPRAISASSQLISQALALAMICASLVLNR